MKKIYKSEEENALSRAMFGKIIKTLGFQYFNSHTTKVGTKSEWSLSKNISNVQDRKLLQRVNHHPVHILDHDGNYSPSALIPFCSFGEVSTEVSIKLKQFDIPVCNSFQPTVLKNQLCYQTDLEKYKDKRNLRRQLDFGLILILDLNEDRQLNLEVGNYLDEEENMKNFLKHEDENTFYTYLDTVSPVMLAGEGQYNLNVLKQIEVTESFLGLDESDRRCQNQEPYDNCTTRTFIELMREKCGCITLAINLQNEV